MSLVPIPEIDLPNNAMVCATVEMFGVADTPLVVVELPELWTVPASDSAAYTSTVARSLCPSSDKEADVASSGHMLFAMVCFMPRCQHYVSFCRRVSKPCSFFFFNDVPATTPGYDGFQAVTALPIHTQLTAS